MLRHSSTVAAIAGFLALFGFFAFQIGVASHHQKNQSPPGQQWSEKSGDQKGHAEESQSASSVQIDCDPNCAAKESAENRNESAIARLFRKTLDDPLALFTALLAIATLSLVVVVVFQARDARMASIRQLRAYVFVTKIYRIDTPNRLYFCAELETRNTGQTPAYEVRDRQVIDADFFPRQRPFANWDEDGGDAVRLSMSPIGPGYHQESRVNLQRILDDDELRLIENDLAAIWVYGAITYKDAFGNNRTTKYRLHSIGDGYKRGRFVYDQEGNDAD